MSSSWKSELFGDSLKNKEGSFSVEEGLAGKKLIGIYFSAHWCPPCRAFTPVLAEFYEEIKANDSSVLEIVFVTSDRDEASFNDYYSHMPWLALEHRQTDLIRAIKTKYGVSGIPTLIILNGETGEIIDATADETVQNVKGSTTKALSSWGVSA